jgi:hypothetical protein
MLTQITKKAYHSGSHRAREKWGTGKREQGRGKREEGTGKGKMTETPIEHQ